MPPSASARAEAPESDTGALHLLELQARTKNNHDPVRRRPVAAIAGVLLLLAVLVPAGLWTHFQASHIVTRNALIRAHLSELGVRGEGLVAEILVDAGDTVRAGDLLARLDDSHLQAQRREALAALDTLTAEIDLKRQALDLARRTAAVALAQADTQYAGRSAEAEAAASRAEEAAAIHDARRRLIGDGAISPEQVRRAETEARTARALADAARAAAAGAAEGIRAAELEGTAAELLEAELRVLEARRRQAEARLHQIDTDIAATRVIAPSDGAIVRRLGQPGMAVETGMPILSMWLHRGTWIEAWVPEEKISALGDGDAVSVSFPALPGERFSGTITRVGLATDFEMPVDYLPQSREARMRPTPQVGVAVRLDELPALLRPGMSAVVDIPLGDV